MTSYKNFTTAVESKFGRRLKMNEMRNGFYVRDDDTLAAFAAKKTGAEGDRIAEQYFDDDGRVFVSVIRIKKDIWADTMRARQPVSIFTGGQFEETTITTKRVKNKNGPGYFYQETPMTKVLDGVREAGDFLLESVTPVNDAFRLIFKKIV